MNDDEWKAYIQACGCCGKRVPQPGEPDADERCFVPAFKRYYHRFCWEVRMGGATLTPKYRRA